MTVSASKPGGFQLLAGSSDDHQDDETLEMARTHVRSVDQAETAPFRDKILKLIDEHDDIAVRTCRPGHLTGSAVVIDPTRQVMVLLFHTKLQRWLQPGGHADGDTNLARVALREAEEETGIEGLQVVVPAIDIDIHEVDPPKEDAHLHLDVRYLVIAPPGSIAERNHESQDLRWVALGDLEKYDVDPGLIRMAQNGFRVALDLYPPSDN